MTAFESYLLKRGYKRYNTITKLEDYKSTESTMGCLHFRYELNGKKFVFGLNEDKMPPCLSYPQLVIRKNAIYENEKVFMNLSNDAYTERIISMFTFEWLENNLHNEYLKFLYNEDESQLTINLPSC